MTGLQLILEGFVLCLGGWFASGIAETSVGDRAGVMITGAGTAFIIMGLFTI